MHQVSPIVVVQELSKRYGDLSALNNCVLEIGRGSIFGLLGPNGAGKTTLIRSLLGFVKPTAGKAFVNGFDSVSESRQVRASVAYLPAEAKLFRAMRGRTALDFFSRIHPLASHERALEIASRLKLDLTRRVAFMSTGMRQKLAIACVMACRAPLLILDEPTSALDPSVRKEVLELIRQSQRSGSTVIFSSHILSEIEEVCDLAAVMHQGSVIKSVDVAALRLSIQEQTTGLKKIYESCFDCS